VKANKRRRKTDPYSIPAAKKVGTSLDAEDDEQSDSECEFETAAARPESSRKGISTKRVPNPDYEKHRMLFVLLGNVVQLLCVRVVTTVALYEARDLLIRYGKLFNECFPKASPSSKGGIVVNFHFAIHHLVGTYICSEICIVKIYNIIDDSKRFVFHLSIQIAYSTIQVPTTAGSCRSSDLMEFLVTSLITIAHQNQLLLSAGS
jgi:hypothetical protein